MCVEVYLFLYITCWLLGTILFHLEEIECTETIYFTTEGWVLSKDSTIKNPYSFIAFYHLMLVPFVLVSIYIWVVHNEEI